MMINLLDILPHTDLNLAKKEKALLKALSRAEIAQSVEQGTENPRVRSSILRLGTSLDSIPSMLLIAVYEGSH